MISSNANALLHRAAARRHYSSGAVIPSSRFASLTIPVVVVSRIIGRGGETLRAICDQTGATRIYIDDRKSADGAKVKIHGPTDDICATAANDVRVLAKALANNKGRWAPFRGGKNIYSLSGNIKIRKPGCPICKERTGSANLTTVIKGCIEHIRSKQHVRNARREFCKCGGACVEECNDPLLNLLSCPKQRAAHEDMGYLVDEIIEAYHDMCETEDAKTDGAAEEALKIPPVKDWLVLMSRCYVGWDGTPSSSKKETDASPSIEAAIDRLRLDEPPPTFQRPSIPARLPFVKKRRSKRVELAWPFRPGIILPFAASKVTGEHLLSGVDVVATSGFIFAMWGVGRGLKEAFLIQRIGDAIVVKNQTRQASHQTNDIGMLAESLCCPSSTSIYKSSYSLSKYRIGDLTLLLSSEVDGLHPTRDRTVEIKVQRNARSSLFNRKKMMQAYLNGSSHLAALVLSKDETHVTSLSEFCVEEYKEKNSDAWIYAGQRIRHVMKLVTEHPLVRGATDFPVQMRFGSDKLPIFEPAPPDSTVVPTTHVC